MRGRKPHQVAAQEAFEEAGLIGKMISKRPIGNYHYTKRLSPQQELLCEVLVYLFEVERQLDNWPEKGQRETRWFEPSEAAMLVDEGALGEILRSTFHVG